MIKVPQSLNSRCCRMAAAALLSLATLGRTAAGVEPVLGHYAGAWTNLTFGSTGGAVIEINAAGPAAAIVFDMDGFVFGAFDPPVISMPGTVDGNLIHIDSKGQGLFGDILGTVDATAGTFESVLSNIPGGGISKVTAAGTIIDGTMKLAYIVEFPGPTGPQNPATGVMVVKKASTPVITSVELEGADVLIRWTGGTSPHQVQVREVLTSGDWVNHGSATPDSSARIPITTGTLFIRVSTP